MPYARNHRNSKLMKDDDLMAIIEDLMAMDLGKSIAIDFESTKEMLAMERKIRALLDRLGRREDFKLGRKKNFILVIDTKEKNNTNEEEKNIE